MAGASYAHQLSLSSLPFPGLLFCSAGAAEVAGFSGSSWSLDTILSNILDIFALKNIRLYIAPKVPEMFQSVAVVALVTWSHSTWVGAMKVLGQLARV